LARGGTAEAVPFPKRYWLGRHGLKPCPDTDLFATSMILRKVALLFLGRFRDASPDEGVRGSISTELCLPT